MQTSARFEAEVLSLLAKVKAKKENLQARHKAELEAVDRELEAVMITSRLLRQPTQEGAESTGMVSIIPSDLTGRTIKQACIEIARKNGGVVRVTQAKNALLTAGVLKLTKHSWGIVNTTLIRAKEFEKHPNDPGAYRLVNFDRANLSAA
jgi:hypothetical protein